MKTIWLAAVVAAGVAAVCQADGAGWLSDMEAAKKTAAEKNRPILVDFSGSDWCGWCMKLDKEVFSTEQFRKFAADNLVLVLADFPRRKEQSAEQRKANDALAEKYNIEGFPTVLLLDASGRELARTGYRPGGAEAYVKHLKELVEKAGYKIEKK